MENKPMEWPEKAKVAQLPVSLASASLTDD